MNWEARIALAAALVVGVPYLINQILTVYPKPETQSALWTQSNPQAVLAPLTCGHSWSSSSEIGSGAGTGFAHYEKSFDARLILRREALALAMTALRDDLRNRLHDSGGRILQETGNSATGYYLRYQSGRSLGEARVLPPEKIDSSLVDRRALCAGEIAVELRTSLAEKWFRSDRDLLAELQNPGSR